MEKRCRNVCAKTPLQSWEDTLKEQCWLLPFTHGIHVRAIETAVCTAEARGAMLLPVALIAVPLGGRSPSVRLEHIQQAKDFLEVVQHIAARHQVPVECHEVFTPNVGKSVRQLIQDLHCDSLVLISGEQDCPLLSIEETRELLMAPPTSLVLIRLPVQKPDRRAVHPVVYLFSWLRAFCRYQGEESWQRELIVTQHHKITPLHLTRKSGTQDELSSCTAKRNDR